MGCRWNHTFIELWTLTDPKGGGRERERENEHEKEMVNQVKQLVELKNNQTFIVRPKGSLRIKEKGEMTQYFLPAVLPAGMPVYNLEFRQEDGEGGSPSICEGIQPKERGFRPNA